MLIQERWVEAVQGLQANDQYTVQEVGVVAMAVPNWRPTAEALCVEEGILCVKEVI